MAKVGRPSDFTQKIADEICDKIISGKSLREICKPSKMPDRATVNRWLHSKDGFRDQYTRAYEEQADYFADEAVETVKSKTLEAADKAVRVKVYMWRAGQQKGSLWGNKQQIDHTASKGRIAGEPLTDDELMAIAGNPDK